MCANEELKVVKRKKQQEGRKKKKKKKKNLLSAAYNPPAAPKNVFKIRKKLESSSAVIKKPTQDKTKEGKEEKTECLLMPLGSRAALLLSLARPHKNGTRAALALVLCIDLS
jgi:hypothetical protein